jgi:hypothetical protein
VQTARTVAKTLSSLAEAILLKLRLFVLLVCTSESREKTSRYKRKQISLPYLAVYLAVSTHSAVCLCECAAPTVVLYGIIISEFSAPL